MIVELNQKKLSIDLTAAMVAILIFVWSVYYYYTTLTGTEEGPESVLFIRPVFYGMLICFPFVLWSTVSIESRKETAEVEKADGTNVDRGFLEPKRLILTALSAAYCLGLPFLGYLIPSILFVMVSGYVFGSHSLWILVVLPIVLAAILAFVFHTLLVIPIPIWPVWFGG